VYNDLQDAHVYLDAASMKVVEQRMAEFGENFSLAVRQIIAAYDGRIDNPANVATPLTAEAWLAEQHRLRENR